MVHAASSDKVFMEKIASSPNFISFMENLSGSVMRTLHDRQSTFPDAVPLIANLLASMTLSDTDYSGEISESKLDEFASLSSPLVSKVYRMLKDHTIFKPEIRAGRVNLMEAYKYILHFHVLADVLQGNKISAALQAIENDVRIQILLQLWSQAAKGTDAERHCFRQICFC